MNEKQTQVAVIAIIVVLVAAIGALSWSIYDTNQKFMGLESALASRAQLVDASLQKIDDDSKEADTAIHERITNVSDTLSSAIIDLSQDVAALSTETSQTLGQLQNQLEVSESSIRELQSDVANLDGDFSSFIQDLYPAVVSIQTNKGQGSGFFVTGDGYIATNYHVMEGATSAQIVTSDSKVHSPVFLVGTNEEYDIAVLKVEDDNFMVLDFEDIDNVRPGQTVVAIGNPLGLSFSLTQGVISALNRKVEDSPVDFIQIDTPINPGNSGGPVINADGNIVGIATSKVEGSDNIGFAIPSDQAIGIVQEILDEVNVTI